MQILINKTIQESREINFPYFTKSENGVFYGHYSPTQCVMISHYLITILTTQNGFEHSEIKQTEFEQAFNKSMTEILTITNNPL